MTANPHPPTEGELPEYEAVSSFVMTTDPGLRIFPLEVMNVEQAASFLQFHPDTIRELARAGQVPCKKIGREWRFGRNALLAFIENRPVQAPRNSAWTGCSDDEVEERKGWQR